MRRSRTRCSTVMQVPSSAFDSVVRQRVLTGDMFVRVKIWSPDGVVLYSDEPELIGQQFTLGAEQRAVLTVPATVAEVSNLTASENAFERSQGQLVEVYRPVWTPVRQPRAVRDLYDVRERHRTYRQPVARLRRDHHLEPAAVRGPHHAVALDPHRSAQAGREARELLQRALDASLEERQRIAADLHDGVVQELVAASLLVAGASGSAEGAAADQLATAAGAVRSSVSSLRTLLVDIYPPNLESAGLARQPRRPRRHRPRPWAGGDRHLRSGGDRDPHTEQHRFIYRTTQECPKRRQTPDAEPSSDSDPGGRPRPPRDPRRRGWG